MVLPAELLPRRSVTVDHGLAAGTVGNWPRRFRANAKTLRYAATVLFTDLDAGPPDLVPVSEPSLLGDAVVALGAFAAAATRLLGPSASPWDRICLFTRGRLLAETYSYG